METNEGPRFHEDQHPDRSRDQFNNIPAERGWKIFPVYSINDRGVCSCKLGKACQSPGKHPRTQHGVKDATNDPDMIRTWAASYPGTNWGVACGAASGVFVIDVDSKHGGFASLDEFEQENGALPVTLRAMSGGGGRHYFFKYAEGITNKRGWLPGVDVRSDGGYVVLPPGSHISGGRYRWEDATAEVVDAPLSVVESIRSSSISQRSEGRLEDSASILAGVPEGARDDTLFRWACRLRRQHESDADGGRAVVETLVLSAAQASGFPERDALAKVDQAFKQDHTDDEPGWGSVEEEPDSWQPVDLTDILEGRYEPPRTTLMRRSDGVHLLYPGKVHSFYGEPESGKSFVAQGVSAQVLMAGGSVLYLDYETDAPTVVERLLLMGVAIDDVREGFTYVAPDSKPGEGLDELLGRSYDLAVVDGVTEALVISDAKSIDNDDVTKWIRRVCRRIADKTGAAVVMVDHVTKSKDGRGRSALGAQAKLAALSGPAYIFDVDAPLGRGMRGVVQVRIGKDRLGAVRPHATEWRKSDRTQLVATVVVDSTGQGTVFTIEPPEAIAAKYRQDAETVQHALQAHTIVAENEGINTKALKDQLKRSTGVGNAEALGDIIADAVNRGLIRVEAGPRNARLYYSGQGVDVTERVSSHSEALE